MKNKGRETDSQGPVLKFVAARGLVSVNQPRAGSVGCVGQGSGGPPLVLDRTSPLMT